MIIPSNDAFFGNEDPLAYELFDAEGNFNGDVTIDIYGSDIYDSGTEVNDGQGAAGFSLGLNGDGGTSTDDTESTVAVHPDLLGNIIGFQTAAGTTVTDPLTAEEPVARITVSVGDSLLTQSAVGPLFNGSVADAADDGGDDAADDAPGSNIYQLRNVDLGGYLAVGEGDNVVTSTTTGAETQWEVVANGDYVFLQSTANGEFLDADRVANNVDTNRRLTARGVQWEIIDNGNGESVIRNVDFDRFLDACLLYTSPSPRDS